MTTPTTATIFWDYSATDSRTATPVCVYPPADDRAAIAAAMSTDKATTRKP